jgi:hypothetical protein
METTLVTKRAQTKSFRVGSNYDAGRLTESQLKLVRLGRHNITSSTTGLWVIGTNVATAGS